MPRINILVEITKEDDIKIGMFPDNELGNQLLIKYCGCWLQGARSLEILFVLFLNSGPG